MSKMTTVQCAACNSHMVPRTVFRQGPFYGSRTITEAGSYCPICQSPDWRGGSSAIADLIAVLNMNPGLGVFVLLTFIPCLIAFVLMLLLAIASLYFIIPGLLAGESLSALVHELDMGPVYMGLFVVFVFGSSMAYIPLSQIGFFRKR